MIQVYRSWKKTEGSNIGEQYYSEICRSCAFKEQEKGRELQFDGYLSDIEPLSREEACEICGKTFFVDGRKYHNNKPINDPATK